MSTEANRLLSILGVPLGYGASMAGVDMGPAALRVARITQRIARLGYSVHDLGDMRLERPQTVPEVDEKLKYVREISNACEQLAAEVEGILNAGQLPLILGGDHSIAIGSFAGATSNYKKQNETLGLIWFDAHADMNTPETTPSGNIHGMPLATLLGYGTPELTNVAGFAPKLDPRLCAHVGARDIDPGERELIKKLGMRFFTMREIDERGMKAVMDDA
ncbi:MAG TPA: arginase, partial [Pyrinomonadaceae bacterium]|nr:arginase [Pyrinomonadaceae bacterium]